MFVTYPDFKIPLQLDPHSTNWRSVEIFLQWSWFLVTIEDPAEELARTFMVSSDDDLVEMAQNVGRRLVGLSLVIPPEIPIADSWKMVRIKRVGLSERRKGKHAELVLTSDNGDRKSVV